MYGPEPRSSWGTPDPAPRLGPLPDHVHMGEVQVGSASTLLVAAPFMLNSRHGSGRLSVQINPIKNPDARPASGIDPQLIAAADTADMFQLASAPRTPISAYHTPPPIRVTFSPTRAGEHRMQVEVTVEGKDGTRDRKQILVTARGLENPEHARKKPLTDQLHFPDPDKALDGVVDSEPLERSIEADNTEQATKAAEDEADRLVDSQRDGVDLAVHDISNFEKAKLPPSAIETLIDIAFMMGTASISSAVARFAGIALGKALAQIQKSSIRMVPVHGPTPPAGPRPHPSFPAGQGTFFPNKAPNPVSEETKLTSTDHLTPLLTDGIKEGFKNTAKASRAALSPQQERQAQVARTQLYNDYTTNPRTAFIREQKKVIRERGASYKNIPRDIRKALGSIDPDTSKAVMLTLAEGLGTASVSADKLQANATKLQWITALAHQRHGTEAIPGPDGNTHEVTNLEGTRGTEDPRQELPNFDAILDIEIDVPAGSTPIEESGFKVMGASIVGVSNAVASTLARVDLANAGIPIRLLVSGHPAVITRDELGRVRVTGHLLTQGQGLAWTEASMHRGAKFLVDKVLGKTLEHWGVKTIKTNDAGKAG